MGLELTDERRPRDQRLPAPEPLPDNIRSTQPGGGVIQEVELAWGVCRRFWLKRLRPGYVRRMQGLLKGDRATCPVEVIDSRDLKFFRNIAQCWFEPHDDPFTWRDRLPFARAGFAELLVFGFGSLAICCVLAAVAVEFRWLAAMPAGLSAFVFWFFRDPGRRVPIDPDVVVSPADGTIVEIAEVNDHEYVDGPAFKIGIFLSVFNVHVNRCAMAGTVIRMRYAPGRFLNAMRPESAGENERLEIRMLAASPPFRRFVMHQIAGAIARRIVCNVRPGETLATGQRFGMIKFGSRTELLIPRDGLELLAKMGDKVRGGSTVIGRYVALKDESGG